MAFTVRNLSVLAYANGFTLWHYKAGAEDVAAVSGTGYFTQAGDMLNAGDMIMVSGGGGGRLLCLQSDRAGMKAAPLHG
jgi:hypothetical protein